MKAPDIIVLSDLSSNIRPHVSVNEHPTEVNLDHLAEILKADTLLRLARQRKAEETVAVPTPKV